MAFFDDFTSALKQKWLQYYQLNHGWLALQMEVESIKTPDGGRRPSSYLILGILNALEPKLAQLMLPFSKLNSNADALIDVLELNFDPDIALGNRPPAQAASIPSATPTPPAQRTTDALIDDDSIEDDLIDDEESFDDLSVEVPQPRGFGLGAAALGVGAVAAGVGAVAAVSALQDSSGLDEEMDLDDLSEDAPVTEELAVSGLDDLGLDDFGSESLEELSDEDTEGFADISLDEFGETSSQAKRNTSEDDFGALTDVWGDSTEELSEESLADFGDISLDEFGSDSDKKSDDDSDAFGDLEFDPFAEPNKLEDEWK